MKKNIHPAENYNKKREILFKTITGDHYCFSKAKDYLEVYKENKALTLKEYSGIKAEIEFYENFRKELNLILGGDFGDHCDFGATINGISYKLDVTTNHKYKRYEDYEPFQSQGDKYKIVIAKNNNFEIVDINFPNCKECRDKKIFPVFNISCDDYGHSEQTLLHICPICDYYEQSQTLSFYNLRSPNHELYLYTEGMYDTLNDYEYNSREYRIEEKRIYDYKEKLFKETVNSSFKFLRNELGNFIAGLGSPTFIPTSSDGDGYSAQKLDFVHPFVSAYLCKDREYLIDEIDYL